jgi:hypothetical protein
MSVVNCRVIICRGPISQNLSLIPPSIQCKSNSFPACFKSIFLARNMSRSRQNKPNSFCYICGEVVLKSQTKPLSQLVRKAYELYFGCEVGHEDKVLAPKVCCSSCSRTLAGRLKGTHKSVTFAVPMVWREPRDHLNDCYFCMTKITCFSRFSVHKIEYTTILSALRPVLHDESMPVPKTPRFLYSWLRFRNGRE